VTTSKIFANWNWILWCFNINRRNYGFNFCCYSLYRNTVRLAIRKITYAPERPLPQVRIVVFTSLEHHVKDSQCSWMSQSCFFGDKIEHAKSMSFSCESVIWRNESGIYLSYLEITSNSFFFFFFHMIIIFGMTVVLFGCHTILQINRY